MCENVPEPPTADSQPKHEDWLGFEAFAKRATRLALNDACSKWLNIENLNTSWVHGLGHEHHGPEPSETCARHPDCKHDSTQARKFHKSCVLSSFLSEEQVRELCQCAGGDAESDQSKELYPFDQNDRARHYPLCPLIRLKSQYSSSKLAEVCRLGMLEDSTKGDVRSHLITAATKTTAKITRIHEDLPYGNAHMNRNVFGSFMVYPRHCKEKKHDGQASQVQYLMSLVSRIGCHDGFSTRVVPPSKATSANGHNEEFLLRFRRFAHHNNTDIVDSLVEYWTDWGGFRAPIFRHQGLFPWDCTEARTLKEEADHPQAKCGDCSLAKHLWAVPVDAWLVEQLHLLRGRRFYAPSPVTGEGNQNQMIDHDWEENRHRVLEAFRVLGSMAVAMHRSQVFRDRCRWNFKARGLPFENTSTDRTIFHKGRVTTLRQQIEKRAGRLVVQPHGPLIIHDRIKLAGIHRAQPMSYLYEHDMYHDCTLADWADLNHDGQVAAYTALRDFRSEHVDEIIEDAKRRAESKTPHPHGPYRGPGIDMNATSSMGTGDWLPEDLVPEQCDGSYAEVDFEANEDTGHAQNTKRPFESSTTLDRAEEEEVIVKAWIETVRRGSSP
ncbi:hypothetical protein CPAR01_12806 [Colletotrichum paranaense]|uniref:Uncharacterized protein n=1 Tax=Colletotrichum paranaense TaxID=1914294 RepID=A0ABQ9S7T7_9PEZI|nr:uncharacterized protein CPAR01_12806 [Colletotrichum paranaense]KAK1528248.1 hypothetical protein CPAR01_12806 [Colletotrichum paranaense]